MLKIEIDVDNKWVTYTLAHKTEYIEDILDKILCVGRGYFGLHDDIKIIVMSEEKEKLCVFWYSMENGAISHLHF